MRPLVPSPAGPATPAPAATIEDVARAASVSRQTVSNALNAPERVRPETLERVLAAITELGYRPNRVARSLRSRATRMLGYRIEPSRPEGASPVLDGFLHALADAAKEEGYHLLLFTATADDEKATYAELVAGAVVDGFVLSGIDWKDPRPEWLRELGAPFVAFGRTGRDTTHAWVDVDNAKGTADAVEHVLSRGHRRIAFVGWPEGSGPGDARAEGFTTTLTAAGLYRPELVVRTDDGIDSGARAAALLLDQAQPPSAFVCASDSLALGVLRALADRDVPVGRGTAVVGFDDSPTAALVRPALTTVRQPLEPVGRAVVAQLTAALRGERPRPGVLFPPTLIVRDSS